MGPVLAGVLQLLALIGALALAYIPLGNYMAKVYSSDKHLRVEKWIYKGIGANPNTEMRWTAYLRGVLAFSVVSVLFLYLLQRLQGHLPGSLGFKAIDPDQAFNTAVSFVTNTNWQSYYGEQAMGHVVQTAGLAVQNFVSAAVGIAVAVALVRGFARSRTGELGNFWSDLVRGVVRILLPLSVVAAIVLVACGAIQNFSGIHEVGQFMGGSQQWNGGAVASQEAIKEIGTNGGGYFNANSAHPFENPTPFTNLFEIFLLLVIPFALTRTFGIMVGSIKQGYAILATMGTIWLGFIALMMWTEFAHHGPALQIAGGAMEGKETRIGVGASSIFAVSTTLTSTGAVDSFHSSYTGLGGGITMLGMQLGEIAPGGTGSGLYGMLVMAVIAVFIAGLMVGRTPEYLGKKIGTREIKFAACYILITPALVLILAAAAMALPTPGNSMTNSGAHGFSEILYAYTSAANNNGSAFAGLNADTQWFNSTLGLAMVLGRFLPMVFVLALAGSLGGAAGRGAGVMTTRTESEEMSTGTPTRAPHSDVPTGHKPAEGRVGAGLFDPKQLLKSLPDAFRKLDPRVLVKSPVMFVVWIGSVLTTVFSFKDPGDWFGWTISAWLWLTVLFANLAEAVAEGRGKAQADTLRKAKTDTVARRLVGDREEQVPGTELKIGDLVVCEAGDIIPGDGDVVEGVASVDESAITGESAPVIRESGGDRSAVTGGTKVLSDRIVIKITTKPGETFIDRMINLVEGAARQKTPNEIALNILLASLTIVFLLAVATLPPFADYAGTHLTMVVLVALLVCLIPTTIGALLSAIGIAGMDRLVQRNVLAMSGRAVEAAGDVSTLLLDKTGTITLGNRQASEFVPVRGTTEAELADAAQLSSLADETPEGRSIVVLAKEKYGLRERHQGELAGAEWIAFTAQTRMSGVDVDGRKIRKGAAGSVVAWVTEQSGEVSEDAGALTDRISEAGGTPLLVAVEDAEGARVLGVIHLKDVVKEGMRERFDELRRMGIKTVMITGDNPLTAKAIAEEAGVDDFLAEATPEDKMALIKREQAGGKLVAMTGDGTNDAPALAQADVGVAMNTGTSAAKEAGNMVDLDSNPTKLIEIVEIGKQLLITRGALTTFSIANDVAKYFAIIPALFAAVYPGLDKLNIMNLSSPDSAILSAVIFNALIIIALVPLSLKGVQYRPVSADKMLRRNLTIYGIGGLIAPFVGIKLIDLLISLIPGIG